jgi:transcriptional regulator with PAS, ATPase and Fis domain
MKTIKKHKIPKSPIGHEILKEPTGSKSLKEEMTNLERTMIIQALKKFNGNKTKAAASLKISRRSLQIKVKNLHIDEPF